MQQKLMFIGAVLALTGPAQAFDFFGLFGGDDPISTVQEGVLPQYSQTVKTGPALEHYYDCAADSARWQSFTSEREESMVSFTCSLKNFKAGLSDLGVMQPIMTFGSGLQSLFNSGDIPDDFSELNDLTDKALAPESVELQISFALSLVNKGEFEPRSFALQFIYPDGRMVTNEISIQHLKQIYADKPLLVSSDREITDLLLALPQAYQSAKPPARGSSL